VPVSPLQVVKKVIDICYQGNYQYVTDFGWYLSVLIQLTHIDDTKHGKLIASQMMDVTIRVAVVRNFAVKQLAALLTNQVRQRRHHLGPLLAWFSAQHEPTPAL